MKRKLACLVFSVICAGSVSADVIHFTCQGIGTLPQGEKIPTKFKAEFSIDMTEKVWDTPFHSFSNINISYREVTASAEYERNGIHVSDNLRLSRTDLSFTYPTLQLRENHYYRGTCTKLDRAF